LGRIAALLARRRKHLAEGHEIAGRTAEMRLARIARAAGKGWDIHESIRIPDPEKGGRREVDLIMTSGDLIWVIEQKHWSGSLTITKEGRYLQKRNNGSIIDHGDVAAHIARKADLLTDLHSHKMDSEAQSEVFVVFTNPALVMGPIPEESPATVLSQKDFLQLIERSPGVSTSAALANTLNSLGTWDVVTMNGGRQLHGDIYDLGPLDRWNETRTKSGIVDLEHDASWLKILFRSPRSVISGMDEEGRPSKKEFENGKIRMHVVGEENERWIDLSGIVQISLSRKPQD